MKVDEGLGSISQCDRNGFDGVYKLLARYFMRLFNIDLCFCKAVLWQCPLLNAWNIKYN